MADIHESITRELSMGGTETFAGAGKRKVCHQEGGAGDRVLIKCRTWRCTGIKNVFLVNWVDSRFNTRPYENESISGWCEWPLKFNVTRPRYRKETISGISNRLKVQQSVVGWESTRPRMIPMHRSTSIVRQSSSENLTKTWDECFKLEHARAVGV